MTTTVSKEQRLGNYCIHSYTNKLVQASIRRPIYVLPSGPHAQICCAFCWLPTYFCSLHSVIIVPTYSFVVFPYLEARTENVTKNSPQKINSLTQASCTSCENKKKMKKKSPKSLRVGRILNNAALPSAAWLFLLFLYSRQL